MNALEVKDLSKSFGKLKAVDKVSFNVPEGSIFGLIGRNGAGKTTTIRMMMNIYLPDEGEVLLKGVKVGQEFKNRVGYLPEERGLYKKMKVLDTIMYFANLKGKSGKDIQKKAEEYLKKFELYDRRLSKIEDLSKGNQQKVQFFATVLHSPDFIILDEPFSGLDPVNTNLLKDIILELKREGKVIIFSTHLMEFAEKLCDHICMIDKGKVILQGSLSEIKSRFAKRNVSITHQGDVSFLNEVPFIEKVEYFGNSIGVKLKDESDSDNLLKLLIEKGVKIKKFDANDISLHEIFLQLAGNELEEKERSGGFYV